LWRCVDGRNVLENCVTTFQHCTASKSCSADYDLAVMFVGPPILTKRATRRRGPHVRIWM
jgi:hypothetical protein